MVGGSKEYCESGLPRRLFDGRKSVEGAALLEDREGISPKVGEFSLAERFKEP